MTNDHSIARMIGIAIRKARKERGLSQEQLGEIIGIGQAYIGKIERGEKNISMTTLDKVLRGLNLSIDQLFSKAGENQRLPDLDPETIDIVELLSKLNTKEKRMIKNIVREIFFTDH